MDFAVDTMRDEHLSGVAGAHLVSFENYFLSRMGLAFLEEYYRCYLDQPEAAAHVAVEGLSGRVLGFVVGADDIGSFNSRAFRRRFLPLASAAVSSSMGSPTLIWELWRRRRGIVGPLSAGFVRALGPDHPARTVKSRPPGPGFRTAHQKTEPDGRHREFPRASLTSIAVLPECRRGGVAKALLDRFVDDLRRRGVPAVKLGVLSDNDSACRFYERNGWKVIHEHPTPYGTTGLTYVRTL